MFLTLVKLKHKLLLIQKQAKDCSSTLHYKIMLTLTCFDAQSRLSTGPQANPALKV